MTPPHPPPGVQPERINLNDKVTTEAWTQKLNATCEQLHEAVAAVGDRAKDVETHLKANRRINHSDWMRELSTGH